MALTYLDTQMIEQPAVLDQLSATNLQIGNITGSTSVIGDLTIYGTLTALSGLNVVIASTTSTSALSVSNIQASPALDVYQGPASSTIAVFKNQTGDIARVIDTGLTVNGILSTNGTGNSNLWNTTYQTVCSLSASWEESADILPTTVNYLSTNNVFLSSATISNTLSISSVQIRTKGTTNIFVGDSTTGKDTATGNHNFIFGLSAGNTLTSGTNNIFIGSCVGRDNCSGSCNNFFGRGAGFSNTTGGSNNFIGNNAGAENTTGSNNNFFNFFAGLNNTTGSFNNFIGFSAGRLNTTGNNNNFFGLNAGCTNTVGSNNTLIGTRANVATNSLSGVIAIGTEATAELNNELAIGSVTWPLSTVPDVTLTGQVSSVILRLNGSLFRIPIIPI